MIQADLRRFLTRDDAQLAVSLVAREAPRARDACEAALREEGIDALLDDERLRAALVDDPRGRHASLPLFIYVVVRHALRDTGEDDRTLADYVSCVVVEFAGGARAWRIARHDDEHYATLAALLADVDQGDPRRTFLVRQHLAHHALWLAGLFPDHVSARRARRGGPDLDYYDEMGRRGFRLAAEHRLAESTGLRPVLERAADRFPRLRVALNRVSDRMLFPHVHSPDRLMRQVHDEVTFGGA
ncbi:MAG: hypothetical protein MUF21_05635 [Gemmatimonadaceae bacterium]|jgi:hypothetical protein|nr:hypothetical protein [Gemmatimonadaceae bacterium]